MAVAYLEGMLCPRKLSLFPIFDVLTCDLHASYSFLLV